MDRRISGPRLGLALVPLLVLGKALHWGVPEPTAAAAADFGRDLLAASGADLAFALGFSAVAALLLAVARPPRVRRVVAFVLLGVGAAAAVWTVASVQIFHALRSPLTYPLLYLAGDMKSMSSSISSFFTPAVAAGFAVAPALYVLAVLGRPRWASGRVTAVAVALVGLASGLGLHVAGGRWSDRGDHLIARSPHWAFLSSLPEAVVASGPRLDETFSPGALADFAGGSPASFDAQGRPRPRNVVVVILESTGARYLSLYGSPYPTTPNLDHLAQNALVFDSFYAHVGLTANSLAALTLSVYPYMTWREYTVEHADLPGATLPGLLRDRGYRTAFLESGLLDYVGQDRFLAGRGFDLVEDWDDVGQGAPTLNSWGGEDRVLVDRALSWVDQDRTRPFYMVLWTVQSHHPYDPVPGQEIVEFFGEKKPADDWDLGRYLNTLREVDRQIGRLVGGLRERGLDQDTLVVVTGDHGQAFGDPHPTWGHGFCVFDENVRVPLLLWNPALFPTGRHVATVGGHVDLNPTLADVLGVPASPDWQGRSLFDPAHPGRAYFYAANDDYLLGVREGRYKYVYNATTGRDALYDLEADPDERTSVAAAHPEVGDRLRPRLAAWKHAAAQRLAGR